MNQIFFFKSAFSSAQRRLILPAVSFFHASSITRTGKTLEGSVGTFDNLVLKAKEPVIVDFYADWCNPCKILGPVLEREVANNSKVTLVKLNADENHSLASEYEVSALPTVLAFHNGKVVDSFMVGHNNVESSLLAVVVNIDLRISAEKIDEAFGQALRLYDVRIRLKLLFKLMKSNVSSDSNEWDEWLVC
ncbi:9749_t:CDS:2 [Entrophospora sp. SA101]|nr:9749_t:CDS:2 [Entrophospora sp. SA101]